MWNLRWWPIKDYERQINDKKINNDNLCEIFTVWRF